MTVTRTLLYYVFIVLNLLCVVYLMYCVSFFRENRIAKWEMLECKREELGIGVLGLQCEIVAHRQK